MSIATLQAADAAASLIYKASARSGSTVGSTGVFTPGTLTKVGGGLITAATHPYAGNGALTGAFAGGQQLASAVGGTAGSATNLANDITIECIVKTGSDVSTTQGLVTFGTPASGDDHMGIYLSSARIHGYFAGLAATWRVATGSTIITANTTYHVIFAREFYPNSFQFLWINGAEVGGQGGFNDYAPVTGTAVLRIGAMYDGTSGLASDAAIADVAIYSRQLIFGDVSAHYAARLVGDPIPDTPILKRYDGSQWITPVLRRYTGTTWERVSLNRYTGMEWNEVETA